MVAAPGNKPTVKVLTDGCTFGSLSMTSYTVGADCARVSAGLPGTTGAPPRVAGDQSNL